MVTVSVHQLKDSLSVLLASVEAGESIEVTRYGKPIAVITGIRGAAGTHRPLNVAPGSVLVDSDKFSDDKFSDDELDVMLNGSIFP